MFVHILFVIKKMIYVKDLIKIYGESNSIVTLKKYQILSLPLLLTLCRYIIVNTMLTVLFKTKVCKMYDTGNYIVFSNVIILIKCYFLEIVKFNFICYYEKVRNIIKIKTINNFLNLLLYSLSESIVILLAYVIFIVNKISIYNLFTQIVPFYFLVMISDTLFLHFLCSNSDKSNIIKFITYTLVETIILYYFFSVNLVCKIILSLIFHYIIIYSLIYYFNKFNLILIIKKLISLLLIFNLDVLFFPEILTLDFYSVYKKMLFNFLFIRKIMNNIICFISVEKKSIVLKLLFFILLFTYFLLLLLLLEYLDFNLLKDKSKNISTSFITHLYTGILMYGIIKIYIICSKKNNIYKNYLFTFLNLIVYSFIALIMKFLILVNLCQIKDIFTHLITLWNLTYIFVFLILLKL